MLGLTLHSILFLHSWPVFSVFCALLVSHSHLIAVPPGVLPCDAILSSPIMHMSGGGMGAAMGGGGGGGGGGSAFDEYGGIDPSMDPELAMAIRASTEEARAQEEARVRRREKWVVQLVQWCIL